MLALNHIVTLLMCVTAVYSIDSPDSSIKNPRRHHDKRQLNLGHFVPNVVTTAVGIWAPHYRNKILATSYDAKEYGGSLGGACGWNSGIDGHNVPAVIKGAAQKTEFFANGLACGTCVHLTPIDPKILARNPEGITVTVVNSCPGTCASLDVEAGVVTEVFKERLGQWDVHARVVPCKFKEQGITIQYHQVSNTDYDFRITARYQSGAFGSMYVKKSTSNEWIKMEQANPTQWTLCNQSQSRDVLHPGPGETYDTAEIDFKFFSFKGEEVWATGLPNPMRSVGKWFDTGVNFEHS